MGFSAKGSHASYATPGYHDLKGIPGHADDDVTDFGDRWDTTDHLVGLTTRPWYGYQGAWGTPRYNVALPGFNDGDFSGPSGPNPQGTKKAAPDDWYTTVVKNGQLAGSCQG